MKKDFKLSNKLIQLYTNIEYFNRYKTLCEKYRTHNLDSLLEKTDKKMVLKIFENLGYKAKYDSRERFYRITEKEGMDFYFHTSLRYGLVELIFGVERNKNTPEIRDKEVIGGVASRVCGLIKYTESNDIEVYKNTRIPPPRFESYKELNEILKESLFFYEDFKKEVIMLYA